MSDLPPEFENREVSSGSGEGGGVSVLLILVVTLLALVLSYMSLKGMSRTTRGWGLTSPVLGAIATSALAALNALTGGLLGVVLYAVRGMRYGFTDFPAHAQAYVDASGQQVITLEGREWARRYPLRQLEAPLMAPVLPPPAPPQPA